MLRSISAVLALASALALSAGMAAAAESPFQAGLGQKVPAITLKGKDKSPSLQDLKGKNGTVVVFLSFDCPISTNYSEALAELNKTFGPKGVAFIGVVVSEDEGAASVAKKAEEFKLPFPVLKDDKLKAADALKAEVTPEAFLLDADLVLRYRGRIDDGYAARLKKKPGEARQDLKLAVEELLATKAISEPATKAIGCPIVRTTAKPTSDKVTYYRDVLPILQNNCQSCHRPGEVGPFSLMTYKQAVNWADDIKSYTKDRKMPPWKPMEGAAFHNERRMSDKDIATLTAWADNGTPAGNPADAPPAKQFSDGWQLGTPDLILDMPDDFHLGATGKDHFRCYAIKTNEAEDKYVTAIEVRPGNRRVVHHALLFVDTTGSGQKLQDKEKARQKKDEKDYGPGYPVAMGVGFRPTGGMGGWAPGQMSRHLPEGTGYYLPKGADVVAQIHYHRDGREATDRSKVGLYFSKKPVAKKFQSVVIPGRFLVIPAGSERFTVRGNVVVQQDCELHSVMPHMHMLGKEVTITMYPPEGEPRTLIAVKDWDYNWQETYFFKESIKVKAGTRFEIVGIYDNSAKNPSNPNKPPRLVWAGEQTDNEMLFGFLGATSDTPGRIKQQFFKPGENPPAK
jgi:peroxiredoxin